MLLKEIKFFTGFDEANTKSAIISPILNALEWNVKSPYEVQLEYTLINGKVDYALKINDDVKVLVEAKKLGDNLKNYEDQIIKYSEDINIKSVNLFILTNGIRWQFYTWLKENIGIFNFYDLDISNQEASFIAKELIELLGKRNIYTNASFYYMQNIISKDISGYLLSESIINIWHKVLDEQHPLLCQLIIDLTKQEYGTNPLMSDVKKIIKIYSLEFRKIRGVIYKGRDYIDHANKLNSPEERVLKSIKRLHELRKTEWVNKRDIQTRLSKYYDTKKLNEIINNLENRNLIQINGNLLKIKNKIQE